MSPTKEKDQLEGLGDIADESLHNAETQEVLDDTDYTKVKFVGMSFDSLSDDIKIGQELEFRVRARCMGVGDEARKSDGGIRHIVKMDVLSVQKLDPKS